MKLMFTFGRLTGEFLTETAGSLEAAAAVRVRQDGGWSQSSRTGDGEEANSRDSQQVK
jgi:hypothetical protein